MKKLSPKRLEILQYLTDFTEQNGYPPSIREICEAVNLRSPSTVHTHLKVLRDGGYLDKDDHKTRAISLKGSRQGYRSVPLLGTVTAGLPILAQQEVEGYVPYGGTAIPCWGPGFCPTTLSSSAGSPTRAAATLSSPCSATKPL